MRIIVSDTSCIIDLRLLPYLYEIRNNRGVGHVGGDVDPNHSDATAVFSCSNWIMAELIRIFHNVPLEEAQSAVDSLVERKHPLVWESEGIKRVLDPSMPRPDQVLTLLYSSQGWTPESNLRAWVEYKNSTNFRDNVLIPLHNNRMIEYYKNGANKYVELQRLCPTGSSSRECRLLHERRGTASKRISNSARRPSCRRQPREVQPSWQR